VGGRRGGPGRGRPTTTDRVDRARRVPTASTGSGKRPAGARRFFKDD